MQCANIVLISFEVATQNLELIDNVAALEKRYGAKVVDGNAVNVISVHINAGEETEVLRKFQDAADALLPALQAPTADNGLYLIMHAGATTSQPVPTVLAEQTAALIDAGVRFRKINLAGCFTGGNKLGNVSASTLAQYTAKLQTLYDTRRAALGTPWVCAYLTEVTTFDEDSGYFQGLLKQRGTVNPDPLHGLTGVHNLVKKGHDIRPTHTAADPAQAQALEDAMTVLRQKALNGNAISKILRGRSIDTLGDAERKEVEKAIVAQIGVLRKSNKPQDTTLKNLDAVIGNYERYMREKVVVRYNAITGAFQPASLAEYTDNATARQLLTQIPRVKGAESFAFNL